MTPIQNLLRGGMLLGVLSLTTACLAADKPRMPMNIDDNHMTTHHIGRFIIQLPQSMKVAHRSARLRHRELEEVKWPSGLAHEKAQDAAWQMRLNQIQKMRPPNDKQSALIEKREISKSQPSIHSILYFGDNDVEEINWDTLVDVGIVGLRVKSRGMIEYTDEILGHDIDIARAYHPIYPATLLPKENVFFLEHGFIELPYRSQERTYSRFEGHPLGLKLEIETNETHKDEKPEHGLLGRTVAVIASGYASGVDIERIRSRKRTVAGLAGEEEIVRMKDKDGVEVDFSWRFAGEKESGVRPKILITMEESKNDQLDEKIKLWDAILSSLKPVGP